MAGRRAEIEAKRAKLAELRRAREEREEKARQRPAPPPPSVDELVASLLASSRPEAPTAAAVPAAAPAAPVKAPTPAPAAAAPTSPPAPAPSSTPADAPVDAPPPARDTPIPERLLYTKQVQTDALDEPIAAPAVATEAPVAAAAAPIAVETRARQPVQPDFVDFVHAKTMVMERMLDEPYNVLTDYTHVPTDAPERPSMHLVRTFFDDTLLATRAVTDVDWSTHHPELVVASYNRKRVLRHEDDHDGLVAVWNLHVRDRPEMVFTAPNDVVSVLASPFHPHLFVGGTFGGQVLLWDARQRGLPVQRTPWAFSSGGTHAAPVYALRIAGSAHAHHLWSASTDGLVCTWSLDMLARPQETIPLTNPMHPRSARMHVTSIDAASHDPSRFFVATDEGNVFDAQRVDRAGLQAGLDTAHVYVGHSAPVTRLETHPTHMLDERLPASIADLFLTASMDATTAVWQPAQTPAEPRVFYPHAHPRIATNTRTNPLAFRHAAWAPITPLARFEHAHDYVMDARWHPHHPAVFCQADAGGHVDVYHLTQHTERPVLSARVPGDRGVHRVAWERRRPTATRLAAGGMDGRLHVYQVPEAAVHVRGDADVAEMERLLSRWHG